MTRELTPTNSYGRKQNFQINFDFHDEIIITNLIYLIRFRLENIGSRRTGTS